MNVCGQLIMTTMFALSTSQCIFGLECVTWFLKESFLTGSSAARLMLLSRMKKRMRLVKMLWLTILWHVTLNLKKENRNKGRKSEVIINSMRSEETGEREGGGGGGGNGRLTKSIYLLVWLKMKKARASGMGTAFSFS